MHSSDVLLNSLVNIIYTIIVKIIINQIYESKLKFDNEIFGSARTHNLHFRKTKNRPKVLVLAANDDSYKYN